MKRIISVAVFVILVFSAFAVSVFAGVTGDEPIFSDKTGNLSASEVSSLTKVLEEVSDRHGVVVAAVIVSSLEGKSAHDYADDYFDYNNFAYDGSADGVLLLISDRDREWYISTTGKCIDYFSDDEIDDIGDEMMSSLSGTDYAGAVRIFADESDGIIHDATHYSVFYVVIAVGIGIVIGLIIVSSMKSKMKTVRYKSEAHDYLRKGSLALTDRSDTFLYRNVRRVKRETSSGSSTHRGSSGRSHGGGGGKF